LGAEFRIHEDLFSSSTPGQKVAVIFGWLNSQHKYLAKYSKLYYELGFHTFHMLFPGGTVMRKHPSRKQAVTNLMLLVDEMFPFAPRLVIHPMSNGGLSMYFDLLECTEDARFARWNDLISAVILDSCPANCTARTFGRAYSEFIKNIALKWVVFVLCWCFIVITSVPYVLFGLSANKLAGFSILLTHKLHKRVPLLYIFSVADPLTEFQFVEKMIASHQQLGHNVRSIKFEKSPHVQHLIKYPQEYQRAIANLVN